MEALVLNEKFEAIAVIDVFKSFIWSTRYDKCGDFELLTEADDSIFENLKEDYYLYNKESDSVMIIEDIDIETDIDNGNNVTITGRSLESILDRRVIWNQTILSGNLQDAIKKLLDENIISPSIPERKISNFIFEESSDEAITALTVDAQFLGENLYDVIVALCEVNSIGFKITLNDSNQFVFKLYSGQDRSYDQINNPYVVFSPNFENIINSRYIQSKKTLKTVTMILGEGEGASRKQTTAEASSGAGSELSRREMYTDARDISMDTGEEEPITEEEYLAQLQQRGKEQLAENIYTKAFEGQVETTRMFVYGTDFFMGDIIQITNEYGHESKARVIEVVSTQNTEGYSVYPTFGALS